VSDNAPGRARSDKVFLTSCHSPDFRELKTVRESKFDEIAKRPEPSAMTHLRHFSTTGTPLASLWNGIDNPRGSLWSDSTKFYSQRILLRTAAMRCCRPPN